MNIEEILHANLTDEQYSAVIDDSRNILCLACAGSGKSRTLAYKIAYLISRGEAPESIIAFTFTEKQQNLSSVGWRRHYINLDYLKI